MNNQLISWLLVAEVALPLLILSVVLVLMLYSNYKKNKEAARNLILKIKNNEDNEKNAIFAFLTEKLAIQDEQAKTLSKKIINERKFLFRNLISGLLDKNVEAIGALESDMSRITRHYHQLQPGLVAEVVEVEPQETGNADKEAELKQEIKTLKHEIHITLTTLNNIFGECSSMFGEEVPESEMSVDQIITAMESFSGKSSQPAEALETSEALVEDLPDDEPDAFAEVENALDEIADEAASQADLSSPSQTSEEKVSKDSPLAAEADDEDKETLDFSLDDELDDIDSALDELELGSTADEPSWDEAFEESGDKASKN